MRISAIDDVRADGALDALPLSLKQSSSVGPTLALIAFTIAAMAAVMMPIGMIAAHATTDPEGFVSAEIGLESLVLMSVGVIVILAILSVPLRAGLARLSRNRITITEKALASPSTAFCAAATGASRCRRSAASPTMSDRPCRGRATRSCSSMPTVSGTS